MLTGLDENNDADNECVHIVVCAEVSAGMCCVLTLILYHDIILRLPGYSLFSLMSRAPVPAHISISDITTVTLISTTTSTNVPTQNSLATHRDKS